ncbi:hypothetical protein V6N13_115192 [Hibiscus sabdariffa]
MAMAFTVAVVDTEYLKEIEKARRYLRAPIAFKNCAPIMLRLAWHWHWHGTGTARGLTMSTPRLQEREIQKWKHSGKHDEEVKAKHPRITYADLYQLAGVVAVEVTGGPTIDFVPGRKINYVVFNRTQTFVRKKDDFQMLQKSDPSLMLAKLGQTLSRLVMQNHIRNFQNLGFNPSSSRPKLVVKDSTVLVHGAVVIFSYVHEVRRRMK